MTEDVSDRILRLPFYADLTPSEQARVVDALIRCWSPGRGAAAKPDASGRRTSLVRSAVDAGALSSPAATLV